MYSGERHIDTGEAMRHNEQVEQARRAEHLRRCAESFVNLHENCFHLWQLRPGAYSEEQEE